MPLQPSPAKGDTPTTSERAPPTDRVSRPCKQLESVASDSWQQNPAFGKNLPIFERNISEVGARVSDCPP